MKGGKEYTDVLMAGNAFRGCKGEECQDEGEVDRERRRRREMRRRRGRRNESKVRTCMSRRSEGVKYSSYGRRSSSGSLSRKEEERGVLQGMNPAQDQRGFTSSPHATHSLHPLGTFHFWALPRARCRLSSSLCCPESALCHCIPARNLDFYMLALGG
eukprot:399596-Hanusia_phi.AAC.1